MLCEHWVPLSSTIYDFATWHILRFVMVFLYILAAFWCFHSIKNPILAWECMGIYGNPFEYDPGFCNQDGSQHLVRSHPCCPGAVAVAANPRGHHGEVFLGHRAQPGKVPKTHFNPVGFKITKNGYDAAKNGAEIY